MEPEFRAVRDIDIKIIVALMRDFYAIDSYPFDETIARRGLEGLVENPGLGRVWLITLGTEIAGYMVLTFGYSLEFHGRDALIDELFIRDGYRNQCIGTKAVAFLEDICREQGIHALHLESERHNTAAQGLYNKAGFKDHNRALMTKWIYQAGA